MALKIQELIDIVHFQMMQDRLNEIYPFPSAIIDNDGNILTATAWQDICTKFHRKHPECEKECIKSDQYILSHLHEANPAVSYRCPHGLIDNAMPIIIEGVHYVNFFTGQFFLEPPDLDFFRVQAKKYGFEEKEYIKAVKKVPVWNREQLNNYLALINGLIEVISGIGLKNLKELETSKKIKESEERHRTILMTAMDGIWRLDMEGRLLEVNQAYCRMTGYSEQELLTMHLSDLEVVETGDEVSAHIKKIMNLGEDRFESRHRRKDGSIFDVEISVQYRPVDGGQMVVFLRDITERKRTEKELHDSQEMMALAIRSTKIGQYVWDLNSNLVTYSRELKSLLGYVDREINNNYEELLESLLHQDDKKQILFEIKRFLENPEEDIFTDFRLRHNDGSYRWFSSTSIMTKSPDGKPNRIIGMLQDITDRKHAEEEKNRLKSQLQQAQKIESVGRLAGGVAHDFNNMLGVILGHTEMAMEKVDPASPFLANLEEIRNAARRSADLTRQLLAFARRQVVAPKILDLNDAVVEMLKMLQSLISEDIHLAWLPDANPWPVKIDPSQIDQILVNLCVNARDAITGVGKITIETGKVILDKSYCDDHPGFVQGDHVMLAVSDDGCGMDKDIINNIFDPFFTTKGIDKGTGLGLSTVYGIVKQNNGFINVHSDPGKGTTIRIYLPRYIGETKQLQKKTGAGEMPRGKETILVVEDEPALLELTRIMLESLGYSVLTACTSGDAIRIAIEYNKKISLLVTDVIMPEMNGKDLARYLSAHNPDLKCLFASGYTANVIAHHGVLDEGVHFIQKPFSRKNLAAKVRAALDQD